MSRHLLRALVAVAFVLSACGGGKTAAEAPVAAASAGGGTTTIASLSLPAVTTATVAHANRIAASATDKSGAAVTGATLAWSSADPTVATVDASGTVTPIRAGFTTITVAGNGLTASSTLSVRGSVPLPTRSRYVGTNLSGIAYYGSNFPFADLMKSGGGWSSREDNGTWGARVPVDDGRRLPGRAQARPACARTRSPGAAATSRRAATSCSGTATATSAFRSATSRSPSGRRTASRSTSPTPPAASGSASTARAPPTR